jgi:hypothetical protein
MYNKYNSKTFESEETRKNILCERMVNEAIWRPPKGIVVFSLRAYE